MIVIVGVGHVFDISSQVKKIIIEERPDAVCVELDADRYYALMHPNQGSNAQLAYKMLSAFQRRLAKQYGGEVGSEMITAIQTAQENGADVLFIDANAGNLFQGLWKQMPLKEKMLLGISAFTSLFLSKKRVEKELDEFQKNEEMYMDSMGEQFPTLKKMLIDDRNDIMASRIDAAASRYPNVLAVIGDGHVEGIVRLLDRDDLKVYRLREIRGQEDVAVAEREGTNAQARYHFESAR